jgi:hypothetical protein
LLTAQLDHLIREQIGGKGQTLPLKVGEGRSIWNRPRHFLT